MRTKHWWGKATAVGWAETVEEIRDLESRSEL